eukprot:CAMPEP_0114523688 /NCGR_PEP_ID=MMETSP0109-20121206/21428_1 /TAXON_ID=29199 /ORGANISM="Chlorarachnion reptans, Strain CCCM449" /LENGTH=299 /DNA_ID=CAMNT_0001705027 /DNA_START=38 /DNA_END=938 /DNA_ORIENTATION=+
MCKRGHTAAIIGAGSVGSTIASFLIYEGAFTEVLIIDIDRERCEGEVMDLSDAQFLTDTNVRVGTYEEAAECAIVIITAGAKQRKGETREALLLRNVKILTSISKSLKKVSEHTIVLLVANPVDILAQLFQQISGIPKERVVGSGTFLDSMRLRTALSKRFKVAATHVHAYVVGMHGDLQIPLWNVSTISGVPIIKYGDFRKGELKEIAERIRTKAYKIINAKGSTYYGIGACVAKIGRGILQNRHKIFQLSSWHEKYGCYLSWPTLVGKEGVIKLIPLDLTKEEESVVAKAADVLKRA